MLIEVVGKNIKVTDAMRNVTEQKLKKLDRYVILGDDVKARVLARTYKSSSGQKVEITIWSKVGILRSEVTAGDYYEALDLAMDKIIGQIRKQKTRLIDRHKEHIANAFIEEDTKAEKKEEINIKTKSVHVEPMDIDEAILQMELLGHSFYAFVEEESKKPAVVYRRHDDTYGLLELELD